MLENEYEGLNAQKCICRLKCSKVYMKAEMLKNVYEGLNAQPKEYLSKEYFCEMYPTCVFSKLCEFIIHCFINFSRYKTYLLLEQAHLGRCRKHRSGMISFQSALTAVTQGYWSFII